MTDGGPATTRQLNPWSVALTVLWSALLAIALLLVLLGASAGRIDTALEGQTGLAAGFTACSGVCAGLAVVVGAVQLGVYALRWHLDPTVRAVPRTPEERGPRVRYDF